ncbi:MAG TPA: hypothetical protein VKM55_03010 [Candidatus Lokiarchaeia archaeon]|nr:hypothetical protein [Candidatus Lokiarchaeia archaeon]
MDDGSIEAQYRLEHRWIDPVLASIEEHIQDHPLVISREWSFLATSKRAWQPGDHRGIDHENTWIRGDIAIFYAFRRNIYISECG